jgi:hypothetical protein
VVANVLWPNALVANGCECGDDFLRISKFVDRG